MECKYMKKPDWFVFKYHVDAYHVLVDMKSRAN